MCNSTARANGGVRAPIIGNVGGHRGPNLSTVGRTATKAAIRNHIVNGSNVMPAFGDVLEAQKINDLVEYLRSCRKKPEEYHPGQ